MYKHFAFPDGKGHLRPFKLLIATSSCRVLLCLGGKDISKEVHSVDDMLLSTCMQANTGEATTAVTSSLDLTFSLYQKHVN